ncbi:MAG: extracellular solute-binding protein [Pararhodobacter sp.]|nr:extracellular solute-binding protein [Pararhodobacter sp.]
MKKTLILSAAALMASTALASAQGVVNLYNWGNYTSPELLEKFTEETGIQINVTDFDSNDTALARIRQGGHGFDLVVPSNTYVQTWVNEGLVQPLDPEIVTDRGNIAEQWVDVEFDPGREYSVPWAWGTTGVVVNTSVYDGDINTLDLIMDPPDVLSNRINVIPEMSDVMTMAIYHAGGDSNCTTDMDVLRQVRDNLMAAKQHWLALDYGTVDSYAAGDLDAGIYWNGASMRVRLQNEDFAYGYPATGYPVWMDNLMVLSDAQNVENAMIFVNFVLQPENAALISNFARYANGITGSEDYMDEVMQDAPEIVVPEDLVAAGRFNQACPQETNDIHTQIWTELLQ